MNEVIERIKKLKEEIRETPYHKGTEHYIGRLRARIAQLEDQLLCKQKGGGGDSRFAIKKTGDATVVLIGPPLAGKSTLLNKITNATSKVALYAFTTTTVIPGMMVYKGAKIQILDLPGIIENASKGKGRGKEILAAARNADLLLIMTDVERVQHLSYITRELMNAGVRINQDPPRVIIQKKNSGGLIVRIPSGFHNMNIKTVTSVASEFHLVNAEIILKEDLNIERLIDAFSANRVYVKAIYVVNKIDLNNIKIAAGGEFYPIQLISAEKDIGLISLKSTIWDNLHLIRVYLKKGKEEADFINPVIVQNGMTVYSLAQKISNDMVNGLKGALIWGPKAIYQGQKVGPNFILNDGQIVTLY